MTDSNMIPENKIKCPLIDEEIEIIECIVNSDCISGMIKTENIPDKFKIRKDYKNICKNCEYHNF